MEETTFARFRQDMNKFALLTADQEMELGKPIKARQELEKWVAATRETRALTGEEERALDEARQLSKAAENKLCEAYQQLVVNMAKRYQNRGVLLLDLIQEGNLGMMHAAEKFDYTLGNRFGTYVKWSIWEGLQQAIYQQSSTIRRSEGTVKAMRRLNKIREKLAMSGAEPTEEAIAAALGVSIKRYREIVEASSFTISSLETPVGNKEGSERLLKDTIAAPDVEQPDDLVLGNEFRQGVIALLDCLTEREKYIVVRRRKLLGHDEQTLVQLGEHLHISKERVRQIEERAYAKMARLKADAIERLTGRRPVPRLTKTQLTSKLADAKNREARRACKVEAPRDKAKKPLPSPDVSSLAVASQPAASVPLGVRAASRSRSPRSDAKVTMPAHEAGWIAGVTEEAKQPSSSPDVPSQSAASEPLGVRAAGRSRSPRLDAKVIMPAHEADWIAGVTGEELAERFKLISAARLQASPASQIPSAEILQARLERLKPAERYVLSRILGLNGRSRIRGSALARQFAVSHSSISQIFSRAKKALLRSRL